MCQRLVRRGRRVRRVKVQLTPIALYINCHSTHRSFDSPGRTPCTLLATSTSTSTPSSRPPRPPRPDVCRIPTPSLCAGARPPRHRLPRPPRVRFISFLSCSPRPDPPLHISLPPERKSLSLLIERLPTTTTSMLI